jgi:hypothetical protein
MFDVKFLSVTNKIHENKKEEIETRRRKQSIWKEIVYCLVSVKVHYAMYRRVQLELMLLLSIFI